MNGQRPPRRRSNLIAIFLAALAVVSLHAASPSQSDIAYLGPDRAEKMDAWLPPATFRRPVPAVLLIHGGGWAVGDKADARERNIAGHLSAAGLAVFSVNYLLEREQVDAAGNKTTVRVWPRNFQDCKTALRYLKKESTRFGIDPRRIAVMGGSAGGHLAMLVGMTAHAADMNTGGFYLEEDNEVACIVDFYGIPDVRRFQPFHFAAATDPGREMSYREASPITYLDRSTPPILVVHGTADKIVPVALSRDFVAQLAAAGIPHEYIEVPDAPHSFDLQPPQKDLRPAVTGFLQKHLGQP